MEYHRLILTVPFVATVWVAAPSARAQDSPVVQVAPAHEKQWEIFFDEDVTPQEYARQLEHFGIEVAAISKSGRVEYVSRLTEYQPSKREGQRGADPRLHIGWKSGALHAVDRRLLRKAGVSSNGKVLTHYFPAELQKQLEQLELEYADHPARDIELTRFQIRRRDDGGYEFIVIEQKPPKPDAKP